MTFAVINGVMVMVNVAATVFLHIPAIIRRKKTADWVLLGLQLSALIISSAEFGKELYVLFS